MKGLRIEKFGKYNCDQIHSLPNRVNILANYVDENGDKIKDLFFLSLVDPKYNGAFSFNNPASFTCNKRAKNILVLFTKNGELYLCD